LLESTGPKPRGSIPTLLELYSPIAQRQFRTAFLMLTAKTWQRYVSQSN
jgi:hypothetical protein